MNSLYSSITKTIKTTQSKKWAEDLNMAFLQRRHTDGQHKKQCSTLLLIREMQIKTTMKDHLTPVRMAIKKYKNNKCWRGCGKKKNPPTPFMAM